MKKYLLSLAAVFGVALSFQAQAENYVMDGVINDSKLVLDVMEKQYPGYQDQVNQVFENAKYFSTRSGSLHEVNVVVHVVYQDSTQNIPDSVINRQIDILNRDYSRTNPDTVNLRPVFLPIAANPNIHFNLVAINRVPTSSTFEVGLSGMPDNVKQTANGGSDAWNTENYMNIWVCNLESFFGALFGYAYPPAGLSNWPANSEAPSTELEGVVLDYRTVGDNNPVPYPNPQGGGNFDFRGRTAVHEVGHFLGLRHVWGDGGGLFGGDSCQEDDGCADTPNQGAQSNFDCNTSQNTCIDSLGGQPDPNDRPDLIENYMDYSSEACSNMFSFDQVVIMRNVLENERVGLIQDMTAIEEEENQLHFSVFPNPAKNYFEINFGVEKLDNKGVRVFDLNGREIWGNPSFSGSVIRIDLTEIPAGLYFVTCSTHAQRLTQKVVVNK